MDRESTEPRTSDPATGRMTVLLATDGERPAAIAERLLTDIADRSATEVIAACVNTFDLSLHVSEVLGLGHYAPDAGLRHAETIAAAVGARLEAAGFRVRWHAASGDAPSRLLEIAERDAAGLVVHGAGHSRWRSTPVLGRTSGLLLHESPCSVLLVHAWEPDRERAGVLVATDGSAGAELAIRTFASMADPDRCRVLVVTVARDAPAPVGQTGAGEEAHTAEASLASATALLEQRGFACKTRVARGHPARTLLELAESEGSSLVVAGSRGLSRLRRFALGSVSDALARNADAALIGRAGPEAATTATEPV
jgi:nucleotide-binding universal stress UspA family protein